MTKPDLALLPFGTSDFSALRLRGQIYVDKTALIYELASITDKFFLIRPRRYGKSLLVSTFASLFRDGLKYFSGLAIEKLWKDKTYDVVEIDFSEIKNISGIRDFYKQLNDTLSDAFEPAGFRYDKNRPQSVIKQISRWMKTRSKNSLVLLIDEYDSPMTACLHDSKLFTSVRTRLSSFYAAIKANDACLRFIFVTGITNQISNCPALDNCKDISLDPSYGTLLGFTENEIQRYFADYLDHAAEQLKTTSEEILNRLINNYGGYCFDPKNLTRICTPWSVLKFLDNSCPEFERPWVKSGGSIRNLKRHLHSPELTSPMEFGNEHAVSQRELISAYNPDSINDVVLLTQAGYLTVTRQEADTLFVNYPNLEVATAMADLYADMLLKGQFLSMVGVGELIDALETADIPNVFLSANKAFAAMDDQQYPIVNEKCCQTFLQVLIFGANYKIDIEGRIDFNNSALEFEFGGYHWVIKLKFQRKGQNAEALLAEAIQQIRDRNYGASSSKPLIRAAAVFSEEKRAFLCWQGTDQKNHVELPNCTANCGNCTKKHTKYTLKYT